MAGPLAGLKVVEMANFISGPYAAMLLADYGAEVIKVELPGTGDPFRQTGEQPGIVIPQFAAYNRSKKSITMNIQSDGGREAYRRLASCADVIVENFRPGTLDRMGIGYDAIQELNPKVVYCSITGMGSTGPYRNRPTYDAIAQGMSGLWSLFTDPSDPKPVGPPLADQLTGVYAVNGILAALVERSLQGRGRRLEVSMLSACVAFMTYPMADYFLDGEIPTQHSRPKRSQSYAFVASDGLPFGIHLSSPAKFWKSLTQVVGRPELVDDPRFRTKDDRVKNYDVLHDLLNEIFRTRPRSEWLQLLEEHDVPTAPIYNVAEVLADPQVQHLQLARTFGEGGRAMRLIGSAIDFGDESGEVNLPPPGVGEHTAEVLGQLGYSDDEIEGLRAQGAV